MSTPEPVIKGVPIQTTISDMVFDHNVVVQSAKFPMESFYLLVSEFRPIPAFDPSKGPPPRLRRLYTLYMVKKGIRPYGGVLMRPVPSGS